MVNLAMARLGSLFHQQAFAGICCDQGQSVDRPELLSAIDNAAVRLLGWVALKVMEQDARDATLVQQALVCEKEVALVPVNLIPVMVRVVISELVGVSFCVIEPAAERREVRTDSSWWATRILSSSRFERHESAKHLVRGEQESTQSFGVREGRFALGHRFPGCEGVPPREPATSLKTREL